MSLRVFHAGPLVVDAELELSPEESHYLARVRRASDGDEIDVLDGARLRARARVRRADPKRSVVVVTDVLPPHPSTGLEIAIGMPQRPATLEALARACEVGVRNVVLLRTARSCADAPGAGRIDKVLAAAQRQCGRPDRPEIDGPVSLEEWLERRSGQSGHRYLATPHASPTPFAVPPGDAAVLLGPEGGLTDAEEGQAISAGLESLWLGPFVLRTEIAVVAAATRIASHRT